MEVYDLSNLNRQQFENFIEKDLKYKIYCWDRINNNKYKYILEFNNLEDNDMNSQPFYMYNCVNDVFNTAIKEFNDRRMPKIALMYLFIGNYQIKSKHKYLIPHGCTKYKKYINTPISEYNAKISGYDFAKEGPKQDNDY